MSASTATTVAGSGSWGQYLLGNYQGAYEASAPAASATGTTAAPQKRGIDNATQSQDAAAASAEADRKRSRPDGAP